MPKAPSLKRWVWVKFRPRRWPLSDLAYGGKKFRADEVRYLLAKDGDKTGIVLFFEGYTEAERDAYGQMGYLFLWMRLWVNTPSRPMWDLLSFTPLIRSISLEHLRCLSCLSISMNISAAVLISG